MKKYNLFSIFDECGNNGCKKDCWKGNEIYVPKITSNQWK